MGHKVAVKVPVLLIELPLPAIKLKVVDMAVKTPGLKLFIPLLPALLLKLTVADVAVNVPVLITQLLLFVTLNVEPEFKLTVPEFVKVVGPPLNVSVDDVTVNVP